VEVGADASHLNNRIPYARYFNAFIKPELNHGYLTIPQAALDGKQFPYARGKGLGGSSLIYFMVYTRGGSADYNRWPELVGDDDWRWEKTKERFQKVRYMIKASVSRVTDFVFVRLNRSAQTSQARFADMQIRT
jgi:choline dehydrogenase-like flavoprotein